ncbi:MAG: hypothetical protein HC850_14035 [Rhodomicrobium sp.]|nr:hypothetical protein [Rhodomicrobium sp.]
MVKASEVENQIESVDFACDQYFLSLSDRIQLSRIVSGYLAGHFMIVNFDEGKQIADRGLSDRFQTADFGKGQPSISQFVFPIPIELLVQAERDGRSIFSLTAFDQFLGLDSDFYACRPRHRDRH